MGTIMSFSNFLQAYRIWKNKSSRNVSIMMFFILFIGMLSWLLYGIAILSFPLIFTNIIGISAIATVIVLWFMYRQHIPKKILQHTKKLHTKAKDKINKLRK